ncbi:HEAT repeat domain-containing protein [Legionella septentrionalis]|uniref:HEAT repeat domain-containing protein n=1 Tax=Legionella septentrionalis TaxID=2498109 RepID=UPI000F8F70C2|nr:HEAT repeat domain-containing protein [Legionella septentrionalis]RUR02867.1 HEAT repeat domain-containing protein [Legionella septentrionalis]RUR11465.1 HEAT repeat domain-containing protein [Legionella septentrionalis]
MGYITSKPRFWRGSFGIIEGTNMKQLGLFFMGCLLNFNIFAHAIVDVYGVEVERSKLLLQRYGKQISEVETAINAEIEAIVRAQGKDFSVMEEIPEPPALKKLQKKRTALLNHIKQREHLLFAEATTIFYIPNKELYTTLEVVSAAHPERMKFLPQKTGKPYTRSKQAQDVIAEMIEYQRILATLFNDKKIQKEDIKPNNCPVFHCIENFKHPQLKAYLTKFNQGARQQKDFILTTIKNDPDAERRGAAIFLVGHMSDPYFILSELMPYVEDNDSLVKNNAIRVIGSAMAKARIYNINISPFINLLSSPITTDRNKSLLVLYHAAHLPAAKQFIRREASEPLLQMLQLKQPNNHDMAYKLLKRISGKQYGEYDIAAWKQWLKSNAA